MDETAGQDAPINFGNVHKGKAATGKKPTKKYSGSDYYLTQSQVQKMIAAAPSLRDRVLIRLLDITGGRRFEVAEMVIENINFEQRHYRISRGKGGKKDAKSPEERRSRLVDMDDDELLKDLKMLIGKRTSGWLFPSSHKGAGRIDNSTLNRIVAKTGQLAGITSPNPVRKNIYPHLFRHGAGRKPIPLAAKQKLLGHRDARTTLQMYGQLTFEDAQKYAREARQKQKATSSTATASQGNKFCHSCGTSLPGTANFCVSCGAKQ